MLSSLPNLSRQARAFVQQKKWSQLYAVSNEIKKLYSNEPEGYFLSGLANKAAGKSKSAVSDFSKAIALDAKRYDAAIELANLYLFLLEHNQSYKLLDLYQGQLGNSTLYLDMAARTFSGLGLHDRAWPLYKKANFLQPVVDVFKANLASCAVLLGKVSEAKALYLELLEKYPWHQKTHYELSKLEIAKDDKHITQMEKILSESDSTPDKNIHLYYALGKELEDLGLWEKSFKYLETAGNAVLSVANYDVAKDISVIDSVINTCTKDWLSKGFEKSKDAHKTPVFVVGLPRTGTTLTERILSSHSQIESADETFFIQMAIRHIAGVGGISEVDETIISKAANIDIKLLAEHYTKSIEYRLSGCDMFIDKYPNNFLYLGFIAKAFPNAHIIYLKRNPLDSCFALFKQSYFKFAYSIDDLARYYVAHCKLRDHWRSVLGDRFMEIDYESLVGNQEQKTREMLSSLGVDFESQCLSFEKNESSSATASTLQVREKIHSRSVNKWQNYREQLAPLKERLVKSGINVD